MLNTFRKGGLVQFVMGGIIVVIIVAFALDYRGRASKTKFDKECAVEVGRSCIAPRDFTTAYSLSVRPEWTPKDLRRLGWRQMIMDGLVERQLLLEEADRLGISIGEADVDAELSLGRFHFSMPVARDGQIPMLKYLPVRAPDSDVFNYELYQRMVRNYARMSTKDFKVNQTDELIAERMRELIKSTVRVSEDEARAQFDAARSRATVRVAQVHSDWFSRFTIGLTDQNVRAYAQNESAQVDAAVSAADSKYVAGCPLVSEIFFAYPPAADEKDEAETRERAMQVAAHVGHASAEEFAMLARIHSAASSAIAGGQRGCLLGTEADDAELVKAVDGLAPGAVSQLVSVKRGFYLLRLEQRLPEDKDQRAQLVRLAVARPLAARAAGDERAREFAKMLIAGLSPSNAMQDSIDALTKDALSHAPLVAQARQIGGTALVGELLAAARDSRDRPQVDVSPAFARIGIATPIYNAQRGVDTKQMAFSLKAVGDVYPEPVVTRDGVAVMQLKDREPAKPEDFEKEKSEFIRELKARAEVEALTRYVARLRQAHEGQISINQRFLQDKVSSDDS